VIAVVAGRPGFLAAVVGALIAAGVGSPAVLRAQNDAQAIFDRAVADFESHRIAESVAGFDKLAAQVPRLAPQLWQRGIALFYVGRYKDCRAQFESHRTVNPADVENAAWHFLCVAKADSPQAARAALLPVGPDPRKPMREIYDMFRGTRSPEEVVASAGRQPESQFYAHLYLGLYFDVIGNARRALEHIRIAAEERYATVGGYMHIVARVHLDSLSSRR
jgi:lipoprotein NlpI